MYEEVIPLVYPEEDDATVSSENPERIKNIASRDCTSSPQQQRSSTPKIISLSQENGRSSPSPSEISVASSSRNKRPDYLPLTIEAHNQGAQSIDPVSLQNQYVTRHVCRFEKGLGKPNLGFSVVGGRDSPRGEMGIFVRRVFPGGQADLSKSLYQGGYF